MVGEALSWNEMNAHVGILFLCLRLSSFYSVVIVVRLLNVWSCLGISLIHSGNALRCRENNTVRFDLMASHIRNARKVVDIIDKIEPVEDTVFHVTNESG